MLLKSVFFFLTCLLLWLEIMRVYGWDMVLVWLTEYNHIYTRQLAIDDLDWRTAGIRVALSSR